MRGSKFVVGQIGEGTVDGHDERSKSISVGPVMPGDDLGILRKNPQAALVFERIIVGFAVFSLPAVKLALEFGCQRLMAQKK